MDIQELATAARNSISDFCMHECQAYCCRKGYLVLSEEELELLVLDKRAELESREDIKVLSDNTFSLHLGTLGSCSRLIDSKCSIHSNPGRPKTCTTFPVFVDEEKKEVRFSSRCFAVQENKLYAYSNAFVKRGFSINHR